MEQQATNTLGESSIEVTKIDRSGPTRFLLFDNLIANIVDYDEEDGAPIVEFSMCHDDAEESKLPVECGICPDVMHKKRLEKHIETHIKYVNNVKRYSCIYCEEHFASRGCAAGHLRRHEGIRPYVCEPCKIYYCTKQDLKMHQRRRHWTKDHICEICGKTFAQNSALRTHIINTHEQQRRFSCEHCGKQFLRRYAMTEHVRNVHMLNRRLFSCTFCDKIFHDTHKLAQHRKEEHLNQATFECRLCDLEFTTIDFFDAHRRSIQCRDKHRRNKQATEQMNTTEEQNTIEQLMVPIEEEVLEMQENGEIVTHTVLALHADKHVIVQDENEVFFEIAVEELAEM